MCGPWKLYNRPNLFLAGWRKRRPEAGFSFVRFSFAYVSRIRQLLSRFFVLSFGYNCIYFASNGQVIG